MYLMSLYCLSLSAKHKLRRLPEYIWFCWQFTVYTLLCVCVFKHMDIRKCVFTYHRHVVSICMFTCLSYVYVKVGVDVEILQSQG